MKKFLLPACIAIFSLLLLASVDAHAQKKGNRKKIEKREQAGPPSWAPAHGYRAKTRYIFFRDYNIYYDNTRGVYISLSGNNWNISAKLPSMLKGVDLKAAVKIDLDFDGDNPHKYHYRHKKKYPGRKS